MVSRTLTRNTRRDALIVLAAAVSVLIFVLASAAMGGTGFPLDDAWIHQTYGRNLAQTGQWAFVPGIPSAGSTSPLYTVLLAAGYAFGVPYTVWAYLLGAATLASTGLLGARLAQQLFLSAPQADLWTGLALVLAWHLIWAAASGMETMLFGTLSLLVIYLALREARATGGAGPRFAGGLLSGIASAALVAARPEGVLLAGLGILSVMIARPQQDFGLFLAWLGGVCAGGLIGIAPYALLNLSLNGTLLPNTFSAKQIEYAPLLARPFLTNLLTMITPLTAGGQILLVPGALIAIRSLARGSWKRLMLASPLLIWPVALIVLYALRLPVSYQHGRYVIPALPSIIVLGVGGTVLLVTARHRHRLARIASRVLSLTAIGLFAAFLIVGAQAYAVDVQMINSEMVVAAQWLQTSVPPQDLVAVHDIGAVGFFASSVDQPRPILDIAGLVSPEVVPLFRDSEGLFALMQSRMVRYLMVLPDQWEALRSGAPERYGSVFCERFNARGRMGGMTIYEFRAAGCDQSIFRVD